MKVRVAVEEEAHTVHVSHDLLEHLRALVQQGKPAQATACIVKAVTSFNLSRPSKEMKRYYKIAGRDFRGKVWKVRMLCVKVYAVQQPQPRCTACQTQRALPGPLLPPQGLSHTHALTHTYRQTETHTHTQRRDIHLHTSVKASHNGEAAAVPAHSLISCNTKVPRLGIAGPFRGRRPAEVRQASPHGK